MLFQHLRNEPEYKLYVAIILAMYSLLGEITPNMREVYFRPTNDSYFIRFFIDGEITEEIKKSVSTVEERMKAFLGRDNIETKIIRNDYPGPIWINPETDDCLFSRY